jgi:hypothetical protein
MQDQAMQRVATGNQERAAFVLTQMAELQSSGMSLSAQQVCSSLSGVMSRCGHPVTKELQSTSATPPVDALKGGITPAVALTPPTTIQAMQTAVLRQLYDVVHAYNQPPLKVRKKRPNLDALAAKIGEVTGAHNEFVIWEDEPLVGVFAAITPASDSAASVKRLETALHVELIDKVYCVPFVMLNPLVLKSKIQSVGNCFVCVCMCVCVLF